MLKLVNVKGWNVCEGRIYGMGNNDVCGVKWACLNFLPNDLWCL
jgi:hypothetical protein